MVLSVRRSADGVPFDSVKNALKVPVLSLRYERYSSCAPRGIVSALQRYSASDIITSCVISEWLSIDSGKLGIFTFSGVIVHNNSKYFNSIGKMGCTGYHLSFHIASPHSSPLGKRSLEKSFFWKFHCNYLECSDILPIFANEISIIWV